MHPAFKGEYFGEVIYSEKNHFYLFSFWNENNTNS